MQYRQLGSAGLKVSAISIGGWLTLGGSVDQDNSIDILAAAVEQGINFIDLADMYSKGEAERVVGNFLKSHRRQDLVISSKAYWPMSDNVNDRGLSRKHLMESVENSLRRLETDYLDIFFAHRYDPNTPVAEVVRTMDDLIHQGKVLYWGTSVWPAEKLMEAVSIADKRHLYFPQVEQPRYHMLDRHIECEILEICSKTAMGVVVWSPLAEGLLAGKYNNGVPSGSRGERSSDLQQQIQKTNLEKVQRLSQLARDQSLTMAQLALAWILRRPEISSVITGASRVAHVEDNALAAEIQLNEDVLAEIEIVLNNKPDCDGRLLLN